MILLIILIVAQIMLLPIVVRTLEEDGNLTPKKASIIGIILVFIPGIIFAILAVMMITAIILSIITEIQENEWQQLFKKFQQPNSGAKNDPTNKE